ncbi:MAG: hypothetical protein ABS81_04315 [Pseudonocardia sp. SCN 72-86]|nr:MAG: hypothetical protein ABS81_04315 [Pseudonocardia sp. SCN 72-86]
MYDQSKQNLTKSAPSLARTDVIDGVEVFSMQAKPKGCLGMAQRSDGVIVAVNIFAPSTSVDCTAVPRLAAQALSRVPTTF